MKVVEGRALYCDADRNESVVHSSATILRRVVETWTGDLEVFQVHHLREGSDKGRDIRCRVEDWGILLEKELGHLG